MTQNEPQIEPQPRRPKHRRAECILIYALTALTCVILTIGHVTFCLGTRHRGAPFYPLYCSPDAPGYIRILKRIAERHPDGSLTVEGDTPDALDSRFLGRIHQADIRGWWRPLMQF